MDHRTDLCARQAAGERLKFLFFWGHSGTGVGPWVLSQWWEAPFVVDGVTPPTRSEQRSANWRADAAATACGCST